MYSDNDDKHKIIHCNNLLFCTGHHYWMPVCLDVIFIIMITKKHLQSYNKYITFTITFLDSTFTVYSKLDMIMIIIHYQ